MRWLVVLAVVSLPVLGAEIRFDPPPSLAGMFRVVVAGVTETVGQATVLNLRTGEAVTVELRRHGEVLRTAPIYARRACDEARAEAVVGVQLGDTLVAATGLGGGLAVAAQVGPRLRRPGEPDLALERWDDLEMKWVPADETGPARYRIVLTDAAADTTCEPDSVPLPVEVGAKSFELALVEDAGASGRFVGEFVVVIEPRDCDLLLRLLSLKGDVLLEAAAPEACLVCRRGQQAVRAPLSGFPVTLVLAEPALTVGCVGEVRVGEPGRVDEVRWCVNGVEQAVRGPVLTLYADAPRTVHVVALVRRGLRWSRAEATVAYVPQPRLSFVDPATGRPATEPWLCSHPLQVRLDHVTATRASVLVGRLGPDPRVEELTLERTADGVFLSRPIRPADFAACAGNVLWVQLKDPRVCIPAYVTLPLR